MRYFLFSLLYFLPLTVYAADLPLKTTVIDAAVRHVTGFQTTSRRDNACSLQRVFVHADAMWTEYAAMKLARLRNETSYSAALTDLKLPCKSLDLPKTKALQLLPLPLDHFGVPVSSNPVWNACVRGVGLSFDLIQSNVDRFEHRRRHVRVSRPWSCRDYHRGPLGDWIFRDFGFDVHVYLAPDGRFLGAAERFQDGTILYAEKSKHRKQDTP